jgi:N-methylhydantoinase B
MDPITLKVVWDRLVSITQDAAATMVRTTFSPVVRESNDYCCSLIDVNGRQLAEPPDTVPSFTGTLPFTVRHFLRKFPVHDMRPGDSFITNDPWLGTGQLNDFNVATPVFDRSGKPIALAASTAHMSDIGGTINRGIARSVHEEGLRIPMSYLVREGQLNQELLNILRANVRMPDECVGDLTGMLAANRTMADRLVELMDDTQIRDFPVWAEEIQQRSEEAMRASIGELPEGEFSGSADFDGAGYPGVIKVKIGIGRREISLDFTGTSAQNDYTSMNVVLNYTYSFCVYLLKLLVNSRIPSNDGCLRPFKIYAPPGSVLNMQYPTAGYSRSFVGHMIHGAMFDALQSAIPERIWAESGSSPQGTQSLSGLRPNGLPFVHLFFQASGGTGAMPSKDGESCTFPTNSRSTSVESTEALVPVIFERKEVIPDSAGPGQFRGGLAGHWTIKNIGSQSITFSGQAGRLRHPARGLLGGLDGQPNHLYFKGKPEPRGWGRWELQPGDTFTRESAGGGGLHSPLLRDPQRVLDDVLEGYVSKKEARQTYGVIISDDRVRRLTTARTATARAGVAPKARLRRKRPKS